MTSRRYVGDVIVSCVTQSDGGNVSFLRAARAGNLDKVLEYINSNVDVNTCNAVSAVILLLTFR